MVHSDTIWNDVLEVGTAETMIKAKTQNWCIVALFETNVRRLEQLRTFWSQGRCMVHSDTIKNDVLEFGTAEKILKARMQNCAFWCYLKRCFGSWNCLENFDLVAFFITSNIRFLNTPVSLQTLKDMTYSLNCISVLLCTQSVYFVWVVVMEVTSLADFYSTSLFSNKQSVSIGHTVWGIY